MLLRSLLNQYVRQAAEGKVREVVGGLTQRTPDRLPAAEVAPLPATHSNQPAAAATPEQILPCEAAFIFALGVESGGLVDRLKDSERSQHAHGIEYAGNLNGREVVIVDGGVGQAAAARATAEIIKFYRPQRVISAGFAGGLTDALRRGHLLLVDEVVDAHGGRLSTGIKLDTQSIAGLRGVHFGRLLTVDRILRDPAERRRLAEQHAAVACDMEAYAVAAACRDSQVPFMAVRVISDAVDDELPPEIEHLLAQTSLAGKLGAATGAVLKRFSAAKDLWRLREDALKASDRLAKFLASLMQQF